MKQAIQIMLLLILALSVSSCNKDDLVLGPDVNPEAVPDLSGTYIVSGSDHLNNEYGGHLTISAGENPGEYEFQWILIESVQTGSGVVDGNQITIQWESIDASTEFYAGTVTYTITVDGALYGTRTVEGQEVVGEEIAYPNE